MLPPDETHRLMRDVWDSLELASLGHVGAGQALLLQELERLQLAERAGMVGPEWPWSAGMPPWRGTGSGSGCRGRRVLPMVELWFPSPDWYEVIRR